LTSNYELHDDGHIGGYYIKAGFCTSGKGNNHCRQISAVPEVAMGIFHRKDFEHKPYVIVQPFMAHNCEIKVEIFENPHRPDIEDKIYIASNSAGTGPSYRSEDFMEFIHYAKKRYVEEFGPHSAYPLLRIDAFLRQDGQFVVNEFEHFEAKGEDGYMEKGFLQIFWFEQLKHMLTKP
jgi:hypothetical protein